MGTFTWKSGTTTKVVVSDQMVISQHLVEAEEPRKFSLLILCAFSIQAKLVLYLSRALVAFYCVFVKVNGQLP